MKKYLLLLLLAIGSMLTGAYAQRTSVLLPVVAGDTMVNTTAVTKKFQFNEGYQGVVFEVRYKKINGTNAGNIVLYHALSDGDYRSTGDTLKLGTDTVAIWKVTAPVATNYQIKGIGSGSMTGQVRIRYVGRFYKNQ